MVKEPQTEAKVLWKERYRTEGLWQANLARRNPSRGMAITSASGTGQIYAWDVSSGVLRQLTQSQEGVFTGTISPDGNYVYYLRDKGGSERGHYVRMPWEGGVAQDLTPDMPPYAALYRCAVSENGTIFAFTAEYYEGTYWNKGYLSAMMGGTPDEIPEKYIASSPITYAERVSAPLLVIQGRNDMRSPSRQMELYVEKMHALGKPFEIDWFDTGHGGLATEQWIAFQERMLSFAYRVLQEGSAT